MQGPGEAIKAGSGDFDISTMGEPTD